MPDFTIEIGHTYLPDYFALPKSNSTELFRGNSIAFQDTPETLRLRKIAEYFGGPAIRVALVDDIAIRERLKKSSEAWRYSAAIARSALSVEFGTGVEHENLYYESTFEKKGRQIVSDIQTMNLPDGMRLSTNGGKLITGSGKDRFSVPLMGFNGVEDPTFPSCQVMDLAWLQERLIMAPEAITVLPSNFENQQRGVRILAGLFDIDEASHVTVFYDEGAS